MPIFQKVKQHENRNSKNNFLQARSKHLEDRIESCICGHLDTGHYLAHGRCCYETCNCIFFHSASFEIYGKITEIDIFEFDVPDHSERESLAWHNEFESWKKINDNK